MNESLLKTFEHGDRAVNIELRNDGIEFTFRGDDRVMDDDGHRAFGRILLDRQELEELRQFFAETP